jgi:N-acetylneuraminate synthase
VKGILIERNFTQFVVFAEDSILSALSKITANQSRLIFVVSESGILQGVLTDGDFRRWIASCGEIDLNRPVTAAMNPSCRSALESSSTAELAALLNSRIIALPLLDSHGRIVAVARLGTGALAAWTTPHRGRTSIVCHCRNWQQSQRQYRYRIAID